VATASGRDVQAPASIKAETLAIWARRAKFFMVCNLLSKTKAVAEPTRREIMTCT
jgi:hypothetical protein